MNEDNTDDTEYVDLTIDDQSADDGAVTADGKEDVFEHDGHLDGEDELDLASNVDGDEDVDIADVDVAARALPGIEEQRSIIKQLQDENREAYVEGCPVNVLPLAWLDTFISGDVGDEALGPINTRGIRSDSGVFCDTSHYPLAHVLPQVFDQLVSWYGLAAGCQPITTYMIDNNGQLEPEYCRPIFQLHHLVLNAPQYTSYAQVPTLTVSQFNTCQELIQMCIHVLDGRENLSHSPDFHDFKFRVWVVEDPNIHSLNYQLTPATFLSLSTKVLITGKFFQALIKDTGLRVGHLVIEQKQSIAMGKSKQLKCWPANYMVHFPPTPSNGCVGLQNLGNTCYMNSALQCLVHIPELTQYFLFNSYCNEINENNPLGMDGRVARAFGDLIHHLFDKKPSHSSFYTPRDFKQVIGHYNSMFSGYHQQDSQEFLAFLLDGLHEDLNRIIKKPITENVELDENDAANIEKVKELAVTSWHNHKLRNDSVIIDLFVGLYKSTLECPSCGKISITFDPFNDLTLPLPVDNFWSGSIDLFLEDGNLKSFQLELPKTATYQTLKSYVASKLQLKSEHLFTAEIWNHQFYRNLEDSESRSGYLPISDLITSGDKMIMYEVKHKEGDLIVPVLNTVKPPTNSPDAFGVPFFISLDEKERRSFGAIRKKIEHRYEQLSTFKYFSTVRGNQDDKLFNKADFPLIKSDEDVSDDSESIVSMANPEISGDYAFTIKIFDSSKEIKSRRRNMGHYRPSPVASCNEKVWTPSTNNNFTNLPDLLDLLPEQKKVYYTYARKLDIDTTTGSEESNDVDVMDASETLDQSKLPGDLNIESVIGTNDGGVNTPLTDSSLDINIEPLTVDIPETSENTHGKVVGTTVTVTDLVSPKQALICEWDPDNFDAFFSGLDDEGEGGKETWTTPEVLVNEEVVESQRQREEQKNKKLTLDQCLKLFSKPEVLGEHDLWYCSRCKEHRQATKQIQIWSTPDILTIHLKRFENQRSFSDKIDAVVDFPIDGLDMSQYLACPVENQAGMIYDLFAVDNHYGGIGGGHYTSYVKNFVDNKWYYYDDSHVRVSSPDNAISGAAYLLFYRKRSSGFLGGERLSAMLEKSRDQYEDNEKLKLSELEKVFNQTEEDDDDNDDDEEDEDDEEEERKSERSAGSVNDSADCKANLSSSSESFETANGTTLKIQTDAVGGDDSSDNVSSIPVGTDDEEDLSNYRRKQRLLSRGIKFPLVDTDSPAVGSPTSNVSDDDSSTYSSHVTVPSTIRHPL